MNDPRLLNDPGMAEALEPIRKLHAIRLKIQDETIDMTTAEKVVFLNKEAELFLAPIGKSLTDTDWNPIIETALTKKNMR
jgi:hypothetical protein